MNTTSYCTYRVLFRHLSRIGKLNFIFIRVWEFAHNWWSASHASPHTHMLCLSIWTHSRKRGFYIVGHPEIRFTCNEHNKTRYFARHLFFMLKECYGGGAGRIEGLGCSLNARVAAAYRDTSCTRYVLPLPFSSFSIPSYPSSVSSQVSFICLARFFFCLFCSFACRLLATDTTTKHN